MKNDSSTHAIFRLLSVRGVGAARIRAAMKLADGLRASLADLIHDGTVLKSLLSVQQIQALRSSDDIASEIWAKLQDNEVRVISILDSEYPKVVRQRLRHDAPPLLFLRGNIDLLTKPSVGFCGSRKPSEKGTSVAKECAEIVSRQNLNVVSGYAAGVDIATHRTALQWGGSTTLVLAEGILHFKLKADLAGTWDWGRALVVSEYLPTITWNVGNAMRRNRVICALCEAMVLIEAREKGGSIDAGRTCLRLGVPLFAPVYEGMPESATGNRILIKEGAKSLYKQKSSSRPNLTPLLHVFAGLPHDLSAASRGWMTQ